MVHPIESAPLTEFHAETRRLVRRRAAVACVLVLGIVPGYALLDLLLYPLDFAVLAAWRLAGLVVAGAVWIALRAPIGERHPNRLAIILGVAVAFVVSGVPVLLEGADTPHFIGLVLVIEAMALLMPWRGREPLLLCAAFVAVYVGCAVIHGEISDWTTFLARVSFIVSASAIALVGMHAGWRLRRREFDTRRAMDLALSRQSELAAALERQRARLELVNQEMEDLLYVASHDLRAPLINVQGFTRELQLAMEQLRREQPPTPEARAIIADIDESLQFVLASVARLDGLIGSLLNVSRVATRTNPTDIIELGPMVDGILDSFRYQLEQKQITLAVGHLPAVIGDPVRLNQAISNLLDNAIKYMGGRRERRIEIGAQTRDGMCECYVRDSGPGIPAARREHIFRLFYRLNNGPIPGEGIGLTIVRKIIEKHGGRVWVDSIPDEGSTFRFTLPLAPADRLPAPQG